MEVEGTDEKIWRGVKKEKGWTRWKKLGWNLDFSAQKVTLTRCKMPEV